MHIDVHEEGCGMLCVVKGMWLSAELLAWGSPVDGSRCVGVVLGACVQGRCGPDHTQQQHAADKA